MRRGMDFLISGVLLSVLLLIAGIGGAEPQWNGSTSTVDGILQVHNPDKPQENLKTIVAKPVWSLGGEDAPDEEIFGSIRSALVDENGTSYLLDTSLSQIYVVSPDGTIENTIGREGEGPGEFRTALEIAFMPDGAIGVLSTMSSRIVVLDRDGTPQPSFVVEEAGDSFMDHILHFGATDDFLALGRLTTLFADGAVTKTKILGCYELDGTLRNRILFDEEKEQGSSVSITIGNAGNFLSSWTLCPDGRIVVFRELLDYKLEIMQPTGSFDRIVTRDYEPVRRSAEAIAEEKENNRAMSEQFGGIDLGLDVQEFQASIRDVVPRSNGDLWIRTSRSLAPEQSGTLGVMDVLDMEGHFVRQVHIDVPFDPENDLYQIVGNWLFVFEDGRNVSNTQSEFFGSTGGGASAGVSVEAQTVFMGGGGGTAEEEEEEDEDVENFAVLLYDLSDLSD